MKFRVKSCEFLSGGRVSSRAVGGASSSGRFGSLFSFILSLALLFVTGGTWAEENCKVWMDEIPVKKITSGWRTTQDRLSVGGNPLTIGTRKFAHGVGTHAPSIATFDLDGKAVAFEADVGVDAEVGAGKGSVSFLVVVDGWVKFKSPDMTSDTEPIHVKVDLAGAKSVELIIENCGDGNNGDHGDWANAFFTMKGGVFPKPVSAKKKPVATASKDVNSFSASLWRGETAYIDIPKDLQDEAPAIYGKATDEDVTLELLSVDEVKYDLVNPVQKNVVIGKGSVPDVCRPWKKGEKKNPSMIKVSVSTDAKPAKRVFEFAASDGKRSFFELNIIDRVLPPAKDWKYFLDLWQHPWAVSRYFNLKPFSKEHYAKMEPIYRALAECGCKALTVTLLDLPWNHQCYDGYYTMIERVKKADGTWAFDYTVFDEYVEFGRKCGLGRDIHCYSMCPWGYRVTWKDESGKTYRVKMLPGTPEFEDYWGAFLVDFAKHLKKKGWFNDTYIAMDERGPDDVRKIVNLIQAKAPGLKVAACGKTKPSLFADIQIENFCLGFVHLRDHFLSELKPRREKGFITTFYVCGSALTPNTYMFSHSAEGFYLGAYPVMLGFDGFLRWAANSWPKDPYVDASYKTEKSWVNGDVYLIYPNAELSPRLIALRAGVVAAEKMRILTDEAKKKGELADETLKYLAGPYYYRDAIRGFGKQKPCAVDFVEFRRMVEKFVNSDR